MSRVESRGKLAKHVSADTPSTSFAWKTLVAPINLSLAILSRSLSILRPYAPTIIPIAVCSLFIPLVILLSAFSGWYVWSSLAVSWEIPLYLQYGDGIPPYAHVQLPELTPQQRYTISVNLVLPDSEANIAVGNFMTTLTLSTSTNTTLVHVRRPAIMLPARSFFLIGKPNTIRVTIPMIESFMATKSKLAGAVEIGRRDGWTTLGSGQGREVTVQSASLRGLAIPHGIRGLAIRSPLLASLASAGIFCLILFLTLGTCILPLILPNMPLAENEESEDNSKKEKTEPTTSEFPAQERERRRRRSRSSRSSVESSTKIKVEPPVDDMPSMTDNSTKGLRRRTSRPAIDSSPDTSRS